MTTTSCRISHKKLSSRKFPSFPERKNKATTKTTITITTTTRYYHSIPAHNIDPIHRHDRPNELLTIVWIQKKPTQQTNKQTNNQTNVLQTLEKTNPAVSQKPPERNPKSPDDTGEKKIIIIAVVVVVAVMVM
jgi:hypothetical protein